MDVRSVIRERLLDRGLGQKDLAAAAQVTESYISQLLRGKRLPPAPERTDIYRKLDKVLKLPQGRLAELADLQRKAELKRHLEGPLKPLFKEVRELILRKCVPSRAGEIRAIFENEPFGQLERLVTQKLLDVVKRVARQELDGENWLRLVARVGGRSYEQLRVIVLEFLDTDLLSLTDEHCVSFLDPLIESWDIDLTSFGMEIVLSRRLAPGQSKRFEFVEREGEYAPGEEPGLKEFLRDRSLSGDARDEEIEFLKRLRFAGRHPTALYYYREVQNLRDPLHFRSASAGGAGGVLP